MVGDTKLMPTLFTDTRVAIRRMPGPFIRRHWDRVIDAEGLFPIFRTYFIPIGRVSDKFPKVVGMPQQISEIDLRIRKDRQF
jgi:hypothetical protein